MNGYLDLTQLLVDDYVKGLIHTLQKDQTISPLPEDFVSKEGYTQYRDNMRVPLSQVIAKLLKYRFLKKVEPSNTAPTSTKIFFKVVKARGLVAKEGRSRDAFCSIEYGDLELLKRQKKVQVFQTEVVRNSLSPTWDQHLNIEARSTFEKIKVEVWDRTKDQFLGQVVITVSDIVSESARKGFLSSWISLTSRGKSADKYVGGEVYIEASCEDDVWVINKRVEGTVGSPLSSCSRICMRWASITDRSSRRC
jgi:C2 domain